MRLILNIIWLIFGGLWLALGYLLAALICFVLIITIPFGFAALRIASYALWPFGRTIVEKPGPRPGALIGNVIWVILFGIWLAIGHLVSAVGDGDHDHRHPAGAGQPQADPGFAGSARQGDRARRPGAFPLRSAQGRRMTITELGVPSVQRPVRGMPDRGTDGRHLRPRRYGSAGVADRSLQPALHLLHARRGAGLVAARAAAEDRRTDPAAAHRGHQTRHHQRPIHRRRAVGGQAPRGRRRRHRGAATPARNHVDHQRNWAGTSGPPTSSRRGWTGSTCRWTPSTPRGSPTSPAATDCTTC